MSNTTAMKVFLDGKSILAKEFKEHYRNILLWNRTDLVLKSLMKLVFVPVTNAINSCSDNLVLASITQPLETLPLNSRSQIVSNNHQTNNLWLHPSISNVQLHSYWNWLSNFYSRQKFRWHPQVLKPCLIIIRTKIKSDYMYFLWSS